MILAKFDLLSEPLIYSSGSSCCRRLVCEMMVLGGKRCWLRELSRHKTLVIVLRSCQLVIAGVSKATQGGLAGAAVWVTAEAGKQRANVVLRTLQLLILQVELVPLVLWIEVVSVDNVLIGPCRRFKYLVRLTIVGLQEALEVEVGELLLLG